MDIWMTFKNVSDIFIVAVIIFLLLQWILSNSRALQILKGAIIIFALKFVADFLGLATTSTLLNTVLVWGPLIFIILLQPEIRFGLESLADTRKYVNNKMRGDQSSILKIAEVAFDLGRDRDGGLIVIERNFSLKGYAETGTILDAVISRMLIRNIFDKTSNMHDGALILRENKVYAASVILPLSKNIELANQYGTRHRSAIGITEETDAVVVVISEERGEVSLAVNGQIERISNVVSLRSRLIELLS